MAFIKAQKIVRDENGVITSGSAAIVDTVYISTGSKNHSKHIVREKLGFLDLPVFFFLVGKFLLFHGLRSYGIHLSLKGLIF